MAQGVNLPPLARATPGEQQRLNAMKTGPKTVKPHTYTTPKPRTTPKTTPKTDPYGSAPLVGGFSPFKSLLVPPPYAAGKIGSLAQSGYQTDVAHANDLAQMGLPSNDALTQQAAARAQGLADISAALQSHLGAIQQATVAQGNAQAALQGSQAQAQPTGQIPGAPKVTAPPPPYATLAGQTAGQGNELGAQEAGAAAYGAYQSGNALNQGATAVQQNDLERQKAEASYLSNVPSVSSRVQTMQGANQQAAAADVATKYGIFTQLSNQLQQDKLTGSKNAVAEDTLQLKKYEANLSSADKRYVAGVTARTAGTRTTQQATTAAAKRATDITIAKIRAGATITAADIHALNSPAMKNKKIHFLVTYGQSVPSKSASGGVTVVGQHSKPVTVSAARWAKFLASGPKGKRNLSILGISARSGLTPGNPVTGGKATINYKSVSTDK
jgi:hypothetical protein